MTSLWLEHEQLHELPLLDLARDIAGAHGSMIVALTNVFPDGMDGLIGVQGPAVAIMLRGAEPDVWAHELAHAIDLLDGRVRHGSRGRHVEDRREGFANRLGPMLLEHQPTTLSDARPLIAAARSN